MRVFAELGRVAEGCVMMTGRALSPSARVGVDLPRKGSPRAFPRAASRRSDYASIYPAHRSSQAAYFSYKTPDTSVRPQQDYGPETSALDSEGRHFYAGASSGFSLGLPLRRQPHFTPLLP